MLNLRIKAACALGLCISLCAAGFAASLDERISEQKKQLALLNKRIQFHSKELAQAKAKEKSYLRELSVFDHRVKQSESQIELLDLQIEKNEDEISRLAQDIDAHQQKITELQRMLGKRYVAIYKYSGISDLNVMLSANDVAELNNLTYLMKRLSRQDEDALESLKSEIMALESDKLKQEKAQGELVLRKRQRQRERDTNTRAGAQRRELLERIDKEKHVHLAAMKETEEDQRALQKKVDDLIKKRAAERAAARKNNPGAPVVAAHKGKFEWPVPDRRITSKFGMRIHPKFRTRIQHSGIDIGSPKGTPITAAGAGEVIFTGWLRGYGQVVIIDHGNGYSTVYAHMSKISTDEGRAVKTGTVIGLVGQTGVATGPHLHFEVRVNGKAQNPMKYL